MNRPDSHSNPACRPLLAAMFFLAAAAFPAAASAEASLEQVQAQLNAPRDLWVGLEPGSWIQRRSRYSTSSDREFETRFALLSRDGKTRVAGEIWANGEIPDGYVHWSNRRITGEGESRTEEESLVEVTDLHLVRARSD